MRHVLAKLLPFLFLFVLVAVLVFTTPGFAKPENMANVLRFSSVIVIMGVGMTFVIISAGIDLSVGSVVAFSSIIVAWCMQSGIPLGWSLLIGTAMGSVWGMVNGALITVLRLPPFVATLASMGMARGGAILLARKISGFGTSIEVPDESFAYLGSGKLMVALAMPMLLWLAMLLIMRLQAKRADEPSGSGGVPPLTLSIVLCALIGLLLLLGQLQPLVVRLAPRVRGPFGFFLARLVEALGLVDPLLGIPLVVLLLLLGVVVAYHVLVVSAVRQRPFAPATAVAILAVTTLVVLALAAFGIGTATIAVPFPVLVMFAVVALGYYILNHTRLGRYTFAIGSNVEAARFSGIAVNR
ncbi:hypothetical protein ACFL09_03660, partial [Planctomycetota bacterium]